MVKPVMLKAFTALALVLAGCSSEVDTPAATAETAAPVATESPALERASLPEIFDCLRANNGTAIAAHRGGPYEFFPENAIETLQHGYDSGVRIFEIDIAESQDGVLFLMHDRTLTRTTTMEGAIAETDWADIQTASLVDNWGNETDLTIPTLEDALNWAVTTGAILELDKKPTTSFRNIIEAVRAAGAENNVIMISYNDQQAGEIASIAPELMMTAMAFNSEDIDALLALGVQEPQLIAWTGTRDPDFEAWQAVLSEGVETAFGTLGRPGERLDDVYLADGDGSEFQTLVNEGLTMIATDVPLEVAEAISGDDIASERCGL
ncbi:glycerophosphodiester phosphodiesterase family protein [Ponticaulis sp.]|uniref:glycerophosphodiester phosphodiesterase family protein n=1 Tax=Ponticaulis sp. TaxID=2020902 RepID=UPI000B699D5A|nr:glycerophosphodiester phosphodiesterase family protein [Ponticaulis sp.]MAI91428.1 glycerophosphodiester phosphodiesterase [Ponticaulis sp.]OUX97785.1 MAG: hypothetical protein CBB65_13380 [Hyphomonadaceae bacterium TMED5]|tara:strand:- start:63445 stop:64410 length:966 start_codon:yes stop_codon:yes gene_type:complete